MSVGEDEAVAIDPLRVLRVEVEDPARRKRKR